MSPHSLKLYQSDASPNCRRVRIFLAEKGISMPVVPVDLEAGEQFCDAYRAINPRAVVPTLLLADGTAIGEVPAILGYLEESFPDPPLLGQTSSGRARVTMWERRMEIEGLAPALEAARNTAANLAGRAIAGRHGTDHIPALAERDKLRVTDFFADLNARLAGVPWVAGHHFTVADITALVAVDFAARAIGTRVPEPHGATRRWYDLVSARPSATA